MAEKVLMLIVGVLLLLCAIQDILKKKLYLWMIGLGATVTIACIPFCDKLSLANRIGGLAIGLVVILISKVTVGKIGMGDGILLCVSGIGLGFWGNLELFGIALFLAAVLSIILLMCRLVDRKKRIPFVPFLFAGYLILFIASRGDPI
jgi:leader peptidase (prepilin peptidase)/N-methyltransferase